MSDFWAKRLGGTAPVPPQQPQQPATAPQLGRAWWQTPQPIQTAPEPVQAPLGAIVPSQPLQVGQAVGVDGTSDFGSLLQQGEYHTTRARSARYNDRCPSCNSGNYMHIAGRDDRALRCFDCGFNPMFEHSTAGISAHNDSLVTTPARGQVRSENNFQPQHIIAHIR